MTVFYISSHSHTDPQTFFLVGGILIAVFIISVYFSRKARVMRALKAEGVKKIKEFSDGDTGKIIGRVVFAGETIYAPLSKRPCVFYHLLVEQYRSSGKSSGWHKIIEEEQKSDVVISDGTGYAVIDAENSMAYLVPDANYSSSSADAMAPQLKEILARHDIDPKGIFGFSKSFRCSEGILAKGEKFAVAGEGQWNKTADHKLNIPSADILVMIPGKKENLVLSDDPEATTSELISTNNIS